MKKIFVTTILAIFAAAGWFLFTLDNRVEEHIEETASILTGVPVSVDSVRISLWSGEAELRNLVVDNPKGYSDNKSFTLGSVFVKVDLTSVFSELLKIYEVRIDSTQVKLELNDDLGSNLEDILAVTRKNDEAPSTKRKKSSSSGENESDDDSKVADDDSATNEENSEGNSNPSPPYLFTIDNLTINEADFSASLKDDSWDGAVDAIVLKNLGKDKGMSTRALGITVVRRLSQQVLKESASRRIMEVVEDKIEDTIKEGVKLLESFLKKE